MRLSRFSLLASFAVLGCSTYSEPPAPRDVQPVVTGSNASLARGGIDNRYAGAPGTMQLRPNSTALGMEVYENSSLGWSQGSRDEKETAETPERTQTAAKGGLPVTAEPTRVFKPSDHVFVEGVDTGPSQQPLYVSNVGEKTKP